MNSMMNKVACIGLGIGMTLMYQRYNKQLMNKMDCLVAKAKEMAEDKLEEMM